MTDSKTHSELRDFIERCDHTSIGMYRVEFDLLTERLAQLEEQLETLEEIAAKARNYRYSDEFLGQIVRKSFPREWPGPNPAKEPS